MSRDQLNDPSLAPPDPLRELIRGNLQHHPMPSANDGFVVEDLDLVLRWQGERYGLDEHGRFRLCEVKQPGQDLSNGQAWTFLQVLDPILWHSDRYDGFFIVQVNKRRPVAGMKGHPVLPADTKFVVIGQERRRMDVAEFLAWCDNPFSPFPGLRHRRAGVMQRYGKSA